MTIEDLSDDELMDLSDAISQLMTSDAFNTVMSHILPKIDLNTMLDAINKLETTVDEIMEERNV